MTADIIIVIVIIVAAIILFATEKLPVDLTAIIILAALLLFGIITPEEGLAGFSNPATITVGAMFVLSAALERTGVIRAMGRVSIRLFRRNFWFALGMTMVMVGFISAFINNTPVVAVFIPIMLMIAKENNISVSKLLIPISFASIFGGTCTLIGTSTNILVNSIAIQNNQPGFGLFEITKLGAILFLLGMAYMLIIGIRMIPNRRKDDDLTRSFNLKDYLTDIVILPEAKSIGFRLFDSPLVNEVDLEVLTVVRNGERLLRPLKSIVIQPHDVLRVKCNLDKIQTLKNRVGIKLKSDLTLGESDLMKEDMILVEAIIAPNSSIIGKTLKNLNFRNKYRATTLAIRHRDDLLVESIAAIPLYAGDALLIAVKEEHFHHLKGSNDFVLVSDIPLEKFRKRKIIPALIITLGVIIAASTAIMPIVEAALLGGVLLIISGCIKLEEAYRAIDWKIIFMLSGILSLGVALNKTGAAVFLSNLMVSSFGYLGPVVIISVFYLFTSLMTELMSNNATAVLLTPIAISVAAGLGVDPRPFIITIMFASSASFMTPVGYQTNTMIYGVGQYKFIDFVKVGTPLNIIFWVTASFLVPFFFPF
jgi:di/tricarboxylate transporter